MRWRPAARGVESTFAGEWTSSTSTAPTCPRCSPPSTRSSAGRRRIDFIVTLGAPCRRCASRPARTRQQGQGRHVRLQPADPAEDQVGDLLCDRPAAVPAGLLGVDAICLQVTTATSSAAASRVYPARPRRQEQRRLRRGVRGGRHAVAAVGSRHAPGGPPRPAPGRPGGLHESRRSKPASRRHRARRASARRSPAGPAAHPPRGRRAARRHRHLHLLRGRAAVPGRRRARTWSLRQLDLRHPGGRGRAADDRRRVRPVRGRRCRTPRR